MAQRRKKGEPLAEPPARKEIGTYDLKDYSMGELVDTGDGTIRRAWQLSERVLIVINGEKHAADAGDFVYELKLPGGAPGALEVLQADVAQGMGYEWKEGRESSSPFPAPGTTAGTASAPPAAATTPPGPPPDGTFDVYLDGPAGGYLSSITTTPELGKVIHLAGRGAFTVASIEGQDVYVTPGDTPATGSAAAIAQDLIDNAPPEERRIGAERRDNVVDVNDEQREAREDRRASANLEERRDPDLPDGRRDRDPELVDPAYAGEEKRTAGVFGRRAADSIDQGSGEELDVALPYETSDELTDMGPGAVAILESLVRWAKRQTKPWRDLSEKHQEREIADLDRVITERVRDLVVDVASRDFPFVHATLEKVEFSEGIKATITIPSHSEHRHELADHAKQTVTIVLAGAATWTSGNRPKPDPDQPKLV